jgi:hypothetical protein
VCLGHLESAEDPPPQLERVIDRLHPRCVARELRVAEVRLVRALREDQAVVCDFAAQAERVDAEAARVQVDSFHLSKHHACVALAPQDVADRRRDVALGEDPGGHLVQQRLKPMMVRSIDDRHIDLSTAAP